MQHKTAAQPSNTTSSIWPRCIPDVKTGECKSSVLSALNAGYTHIDTARAYNNEHEVGEAIRDAGVDRESIFVTTKLRRAHAVGYDETIEHCKKSLELLDMDYIDLYLVHAPPENPEHRAPVWQAMEYCWSRAGLNQSEFPIMVQHT